MSLDLNPRGALVDAARLRAFDPLGLVERF